MLVRKKRGSKVKTKLKKKGNRSIQNAENEEQYKENMRLQKNIFNASKKEEDEKGIKEKAKLKKKGNRSHQKAENEEQYKENLRL